MAESARRIPSETLTAAQAP